MKRAIILLGVISGLIASSWVNAGFEVTEQSAGLGAEQSVTLEHKTTFNLGGNAVKEGEKMPLMWLKTSALESVSTKGNGKVRIYNVLVSVDTPVCVEQAVEFDRLAAKNKMFSDHLEFITVSADTPFAQSRFITENKLSSDVSFLSDSFDHEFGKRTGAHIKELGLLSRAIIVVGKSNRILHIQRVPELTQLPDLEQALEIAKSSI
ncbi:peroxiredoxin [Vibrio sp. Of7-15]|uniref:peroxiredoxin n=1 Tax=Vibrio sp. Of7-15 TaxID=2724879 RepID=UPI001EF31CCC|nr:peroxiredoxin [Vibrio sp. Of7-15]MCG7499860.1 peroxiredoxin [Vibrio sp. Of7-15]